MKLQILIPHYHEPAEVIKPLLDSIAIQQNVDFNEIGIIICHDGNAPSTEYNRANINSLGYAEKSIGQEESDDFYFIDSDTHDERQLPYYPFKIKQVHIPHGGVSAARNGALDAATADYVMFCDADDMFCSVCSLWVIFNEISNGGFDSFTSLFIEEGRNPETGAVVYISREMDSTFVHGKVHRRQYLIDKNIRWDPTLTIHEDSYFNILCQKLSKNVKYCSNPLYLWRWRDDSVCRRDPAYILKTFNNMLDSNTALVNQFIQRQMIQEAQFYCTSMVYDTYFSLNKETWLKSENKHYYDAVITRFKKYYQMFEALFVSCPQNIRIQIVAGIKSRMFNEGLLMESITFEQWIKQIKEE